MYPVVSFDALRVKIRDDGVVSNKAIYLALGIQADGQRDVLGLWIEQTEGAKFWLKVFNELKTRGCQGILITVVDGLKGLTEAISAAHPRTTVQTCIVHLNRNSLEYASYKDRKALAAALRRSTRPPAKKRHGRRCKTSPTVLGGPSPAQDHQDARPLPERRGGDQAALAGVAQCPGQDRAVRLRLEISDESVCYPVRRAIYAGARITRIVQLPRTQKCGQVQHRSRSGLD